MRQRWWAKTESQLRLTQYQWRNGKMEKVRVKGSLIFPQPDSSAVMSAGCWSPTAEEWTLKRGLKAAAVEQMWIAGNRRQHAWLINGQE